MRRVPPVCRRLVVAAVAAVSLTAIAVPLAAAGPAPAVPSANAHFDGLGIAPGKIKHVWLIILENKSYDATFTGLNNNTYLWQTLPSPGRAAQELLRHRPLQPGQLHLDGQRSGADHRHAGRLPATTRMLRRASTSTGNLTTNPNYGQFTSAAGPNAAPGQNGCVYPASVPTLFNQLDTARVSLEGLRPGPRQPRRPTAPQHSTGASTAARRSRRPGTIGARTQPNPGAANATDQYVPKHFPFPWFESLLDNPRTATRRTSPTCSTRPTAFTTTSSTRATTPAFSWITPNNCSDAHDAVCHGNNLSGGFADPNTPNAADQLHRWALRRRPVPRARDPRDRGLAGVQGRRPDRRHVRRGVPAVHLHRQQLRQLDGLVAQRSRRRWPPTPPARRCSASAVHSEPTGPEHAAG